MITLCFSLFKTMWEEYKQQKTCSIYSSRGWEGSQQSASLFILPLCRPQHQPHPIHNWRGAAAAVSIISLQSKKLEFPLDIYKRACVYWEMHSDSLQQTFRVPIVKNGFHTNSLCQEPSASNLVFSGHISRNIPHLVRKVRGKRKLLLTLQSTFGHIKTCSFTS